MSEACFSFWRLYIIPGFSPIPIFVDIGEARGNAYFSDWANQNNFCSKHRGSEKAPQSPVQCRLDTQQSWGSVQGAWGLWQHLSVVMEWPELCGESLLPHIFCKMFDPNSLKRPGKSGDQDETVLAGQRSFLFQ